MTDGPVPGRHEVAGPEASAGPDTSPLASDRLEAASVVESAAQIVADDGHARSVLPGVLSDVPVAILLIDLASLTVTYANRAAVTMADQRLPVALDEWGSAAGLTDLDGHPLAASANPLSRLATGHPLTGEAIRIPATAETDTDAATIADGPADPLGRVMWVTGFPLSQPGASEQLALVVLLEMAGLPVPIDDPEAALALLRDRAIIATDLSFTITDPHQTDGPLIWVNPAFTRVTGYTLEDSIGRNCRFLQGEGTDQATVAHLRDEIAALRPVTVTLLNYRKDGTAFWNQVSVSPVFDADDNLVSFVGVQGDVTERVRAERERQHAYDAERSARQDAETARRRLGLLAEATTQLAATLDVDETLERLASLVVPAMADWVAIHLVDADGRFEQIVGRHRNGLEQLMGRYTELLPMTATERSGTRRILDGADPILVEDAEATDWRAFVSSEEMVAVTEQLGIASAMYVPLIARRRRILGSITFASGPSGRRFTDADLGVAADLGRRAGLTFDNARLYQHEHRVAETLQRSLLPVIPAVDGLDVAAHYLPGDTDADVGGDFYELLPLPDGSVGFAAGDVVGHDLGAAAAMGHLRGLLRASAWTSAEDGHGDPAEVLDRVDRLVQGLDVVPLATLVYGRLERPATATGPWRFTYANAGHPAPLLRHPDGAVEILDAVHGVLLGVTARSSRRSASVDLEPGAILVAFTDGLVERRDDSIDHGFDRLVASLRGPATDPAVIVDNLVATLGPERSDDTAVICVHVATGDRSLPD